MVSLSNARPLQLFHCLLVEVGEYVHDKTPGDSWLRCAHQMPISPCCRVGHSLDMASALLREFLGRQRKRDRGALGAVSREDTERHVFFSLLAPGFRFPLRQRIVTCVAAISEVLSHRLPH